VIQDKRGEVMTHSLPYENKFGADPLAEMEELADLGRELLTQDGTVEDVIHAVVPR
jgi:hypothetical protein